MSSTIFVGVGQCGNQILDSLIKTEITFNRSSYLYENSNKLSCLMIDSESKVINKIKSDSLYRKHLREENLIYGLNGRGSNWCYGYYGCKSKEDLNQLFIESLRRQIERCDNFLGLVMCHSLGGGTGSGLGSRLAELVRDELPMHQLLSCAVAPSDVGGDSPLQYYNCLLSLAALHRNVDGVLLFHNDSLLSQTGMPLLPPIKAGARLNPPSSASPSLGQLNGLIATQLSGLLSPCSSLYPWLPAGVGGGCKLNIELNELLRTLFAPLPDLRIALPVSSARHEHKSHDWSKTVLSCLSQLQLSYGRVGASGHRTVASVTCYRGDTRSATGVMTTVTSLQQRLKERLNLLSYAACSNDIWIDCNPDTQNELVLAFNSSCVTAQLEHVRRQAGLKFQSGAYLHWYYRHGGSRELFEESFNDLDQIIQNYGAVFNR